LVIGVVALFLIYVLTSLVFIYLVPASGISNDEAFAALAGEALFGNIGGTVFTIIVLVSIAGTLLAYLIGSPRTYLAMARDGLFFESVGKLHESTQTPVMATFIQIALATILILSGNFNEILSFFFFVVILFIAVATVGLFRIRRTKFEGYKTPMFPFTTIIFLTLMAVVLILIAMRDPLRSFVGVAVVLLGIPVYHFIFKRKGKYGVDKDGSH
jgi:APA family basic amino acid/polyamine antiporter